MDWTPATIRKVTRADRDRIDAVFVRAVYDAARTAERQRLGDLPIPTPSVKDVKRLRHVERHRLGLDPAELLDSLDIASSDAMPPAEYSAPAPANVIDLFGWLDRR